jgi:hypothetical protein
MQNVILDNCVEMLTLGFGVFQRLNASTTRATQSYAPGRGAGGDSDYPCFGT